MSRLLVALFSGVAVCACVEVPSSPMRSAKAPPDASIAAELAVDASLLRPATAEPYTGLQSVAADGGRPDAAARVAADDAGADGASSVVSSPPVQATPVSTPAMAQPARLPRPSAAGEIVVTEIMSNPSAVPDTQGEWIELHNPSSSRALDLDGCGLDDGGKTPHAISAAFVLEPGAFVTIARSTQAGFIADLVLPISLSNDADVVALICDGKEIDRVAYGPGFPLGAGASMSLDPGMSDAAANDNAGAWCLASVSYGADLGTPGAPNPDCDSNDAGSD